VLVNFHDPAAADRTRTWLREVQTLRRHKHHPGFTGYWPSDAQVVSVTTGDQWIYLSG
jgi:hypothetical protein